MNETSPATCTNCDNTLVDVYCARCGEKQPSHHDLTVGHFTHELVHELVHLDSKLFRTLRELMFMPGQLTAEYFAGRKKRYIAPIRLFITLFAITFIAYSAFKPVAVYSLDLMLGMDPDHRLENLFRKAATKRQIPYEELKTKVEHRWQKNISLVSMLSILSVALVLKLLYFRRYFTEHLVWGTHFMCFAYAMSLVVWPIQLWMGVGRNTSNYVLMCITSIISLTYIYLALRRVYGQGGVIVFLKGAVVWGVNFLTTMVLTAASLLAAIFTVLRA
jgi:hypothetical protein